MSYFLPSLFKRCLQLACAGFIFNLRLRYSKPETSLKEGKHNINRMPFNAEVALIIRAIVLRRIKAHN
jgi:hypothetical protein